MKICAKLFAEPIRIDYEDEDEIIREQVIPRRTFPIFDFELRLSERGNFCRQASFTRNLELRKSGTMRFKLGDVGGWFRAGEDWDGLGIGILELWNVGMMADEQITHD